MSSQQMVEPLNPDLLNTRESIDAIDREITALIAQRLDLARHAAESKRRTGVPLRDTRREAEVVRNASTRATSLGVTAEPVRAIFWRLIELSHTHTTDLGGIR